MATNKTPEQVAAENAAKEQAAAEKAEAKKKADAEKSPKAAEAKAAAEKDPHKALVGQYKKAYPKNKALHITTDGQVFLEKDKGLAQLHQRGLGGNGEVKTYKTE